MLNIFFLIHSSFTSSLTEIYTQKKRGNILCAINFGL